VTRITPAGIIQLHPDVGEGAKPAGSLLSAGFFVVYCFKIKMIERAMLMSST